MSLKFQLRGDTKSDWLLKNTILYDREIVIETDTNKIKIGDGVHHYADLPYASGGSSSINIPELKIKIGNIVNPDRQKDILKVRWDTDDKTFLNYNPEVWMFMYKNKRCKRIIGGEQVYYRIKKFVHTPHLNGIKYPGSSFWAGNTLCSGAGHPFNWCPNGVHTEWTLTCDSNNQMIVPIDFYEWFYISPNTIIDDRTDLIKNYDNIKSRGYGTKKLNFNLAIVIDNPDKTAKCPKLIGPMSKSLSIIISFDVNKFVYSKKPHI